jgi:hypothetical protein
MNAFVRHKMLSAAVLAAALVAAFELRAHETQRTSTTQPPAAAGGSSAQQRVLILRDGGVLTGELRQEGERYLVKRGSLEVQVRLANVLLVATSMDDAYEQRRRSLGQGNTTAHLQLAEWCLRFNLIEQAAAELAAAEKIEPHNGMLTLLTRRLELGRQRAHNPPPAKTPTKTENPAEIELISAEANVGELPEGAVELFTRRVQPVLVNNCSTAGCHDAGGEQKFQLDRSLLHGLANRRSTMRNLAATLELVDRRQPQLSPLITVPRQTHGGMEQPVFGPRHEAALRHLVEWVVLVTRSTSQPREKELPTDGVQTPATNEAGPDPLAPPNSRVSRTLNTNEVEHAALFDAELAEFELTQPREQRIQFGAQQPIRWQPRDEFDPELFNRKYSPASDGEPVADELSPAAAESTGD